jgi:ubiquinone/menaquinone biosynthesis C-methylase UbiE
MDQRSNLLRNEYQKRFELNAQYRDSVWQTLCQDFFSRYIAVSSVILDLGAGWGEFSRNIKAGKKFAMDLNPDCGTRIAGYAEFLQQDCSSSWPLSDESLDVVFTSNFLEHLPSKSAIDLTLKEAYRCLKKGGKLICLGPNIKYLPGVYWDYWDHYIPITDASMAEALTLQGFEVKKNIDRFLPYTMSGGKNPPLIAVKIYLRMPFVWPFFGKQFFLLAEK